MRRLALPTIVSAAVILALIAGPRAWAKLALLAGEPALAARLLQDPAPRGVALFRAGAYAAADAAFTAAGNDATYDRGNSLAATGRYELAVAYYDAVLFANPDDEDAGYNRDIVSRLVKPGPPSPNPAPGRIAMPKQLTIDEKVALRDQQRVGKPVTALSQDATRGWLAGLPDAPGEYLKKLLAADYARRLAEGRAVDEKGAW